jgi:UDP-3-O-[3-hydroxymyristoyl] glucosamine N-acyltransferase
MKTLYLCDSDKGWMLFEYDVLSDLAHEFSIRNIRIGNGCWLGNDCKLGDGCELSNGCWLGNDCKLGYDCELGNGCWLGNDCKLSYDCELGDSCKLGNSCKLGDGCELSNGCWLGNDCKLGYGCKLGDSCKLGDGCKVKHTLCIHASHHTITYWGCDAIQIGCKQYTISKWLSNYEKIGRSNNYSDKEIEEYWMYIDLIRRIHESGALM